MALAAFISGSSLLIASAVLAVAYLYYSLYQRRFRHNSHIPQLPRSLLWGHLLLFDKYTKQGLPDRHTDDILREMHKDLGKPPLMLLDNWPILPPMVVVASHEVAEQISRPSPSFPYSVSKSPSMEHIMDLLGRNSIFFKHNDEWKAVRKRFNPGFAPQHLMTLLPVILDKAEKYLKILNHFASTGEAFSLDHHTTNLTFDIIGAVSMGEDVNAQHLDPNQQSHLIRMFKELIKTFTDDKLQLPWWLAPRVHLQRRRLGRLISDELNALIQRNFESLGNQEKEQSRSILSLSLQDVETLTPEILQVTSDQLKTFLVAGHDTTSTVVVWTVYELERTPHVLKAVRDELDGLFGADIAQNPDAIFQKLRSPGGHDVIRKMTYISAVIKEVLRVHSPAGTVRMAKPGTGLVVSTSQGDYNLDGNWIYINHTLIHEDQKVYGDTAEDFMPERWLKNDKYPASAWRPFERGPRNCIGLELANIEARVIIALLAHQYIFQKVGLGELNLDENGEPKLNQKGQFETKSTLYMILQVSGKPVDNMMVKVHRAESPERRYDGQLDVNPAPLH